MKISFQKAGGSKDIGVTFFWMLKIDVSTPILITDFFIPELFYDYFFVSEGSIKYFDNRQGVAIPLAPQILKTLYTHQFSLTYSAPLVVFGARLSMQFAETYWEAMGANALLPVNWFTAEVNELSSFTSEVARTIQQLRSSKTTAPLLSADFEESAWLAAYSPRHKRRLYKKVYGLSKKEIEAIRGIHTFLGTTCDFSAGTPRIIEYIDSETFYDQPHLNRSFKKMTGFTPMEYFLTNSILQDNLMAASYNESATMDAKMKI